MRSIAGLERRAHHCARATRSSTTTSIRATCKPQPRDASDRRPVLRRPDQRHDRLRGGGGAGPVAGVNAALQARGERPGVPAPRPGLPRRAGRRPGDQGRDRALPDVHQPGRVPPAAALRTTPICGLTEAGRALGAGRRCALGGRAPRASASLFHVKPRGWRRRGWLSPGPSATAMPAREYSLLELPRRPVSRSIAWTALRGPGQCRPARRPARRESGRVLCRPGGRADRDRRPLCRTRRRAAAATSSARRVPARP